MSKDETIAYYERLLDQFGLSVALCWTVIEPVQDPLTIEAVAERLGGDPGEVEEIPLSEAFEDYGTSYIAHLVQVGPVVAVIEINGFQGNHQLDYLSEKGRAHSAYWNVNALSSLGCAAFGHRLVSFEGLAPDQRSGIDVCALDEELAPLYASNHALYKDVERDDTWAVMMAIVERRTGVRLDEDWLDSAFPAIELPGRPPPRAVKQGGFYFDPELEAALWLAPAEARRAFTRELTELLVDAGGLGDEPEIPPVLELLGQDVPPGDQRYEPLSRLAERLDTEYEEAPLTVPAQTSRPWRRTRAAWALRQSLLTGGDDTGLKDAHTAAHGAYMARLILGDDWSRARTRLRHRLRRTT
ncbi:DUF6461 domain-containing protein [Actinomadura adrarensis]|uniref:DUF6461 domain-containing protein n=1 Tax=Actinomadura adrarensis TaxID=1819600 RepID=A0ABW3CRS5_9ACTN